MAKEGKSLQEIIDRLSEIRQHTRLYIVVDSFENLVRGGRIGKGTAFLGSLLHIKPIASLENGEYTPVAKVRSHAQVVKYLTNSFAEDVNGKVIKGMGIVHADGYTPCFKNKTAIKERTGYDIINIEDTTPVISTHTGAGAIGFMYYFE